MKPNREEMHKFLDRILSYASEVDMKVTPKSGEKEEDFISRCMGDSTMNSEFPDQKQRAAVCYTYWKNK